MRLLDFWKSRFYALLLHSTDPKVFIQANAESYSLPYVEIHGRIRLNDFKDVKDAIQLKLGIPLNGLHYASFQVDKQKRRIQGVYVLEQHDPSDEIQAGIWRDRPALADLSFTHPEHTLIIANYLIELESGNVPKLRPPWARLGWFREASTWIEEQLEILQYRPIAPVEPVRSWSISCILKVETIGGTLYFKAAPDWFPLFCDEPRVTSALATLFPKHMSTVISIDPQRHWMLSADFGSPIGHHASLKVKQDIYDLFAQIQIQSIQQRDRLLAMGCLDRRLDILQSQIDPLMSDEEALSELSAVEIEQLHTLAPVLKDFCEQLASYNVPETLVHGDLHLNNVALHQGNYIFFDWTDGCLSHPFFDLAGLIFIDDRKSLLGRLTSVWRQRSMRSVRDRYLSHWSQYEPKARLLDAWNIAKPLCALHHAVTYQNILHSLEVRTKHEVKSAFPFFLREMIRYCQIR